MADTETRQRSQRTKLTLKDLGQPSRVGQMSPAELTASKGRYVMGYLVGKASGFIERSDPKTDEKFEGLAGTFMSIPSDVGTDELESGVLFIPDAFHNLIAAKLREAKKDDINAEVEFAFEISSIVAKNPAGYSWDFRPAIPFEGKHALDDTLGKIKGLPNYVPKQISGTAAPAKK